MALTRRVRVLAATGLLTLFDAGLASGSAKSASGQTPEAEPVIEVVVVTATRRSEDVTTVPQSIGVLTAAVLESRNLKSVADAVRYLPGVAYDANTNNIAIRGVSSLAGAGTTGLYIDDAPIQMRALDFIPNNALPGLFDMERVEVLRGPQGTLYGAGSEGGAVRYITRQPSFSDTTLSLRSEVSANRNGTWNAEAGAAGGMPLGSELAVRASAWLRHEGGTVDRFDHATGATLQRAANAADLHVLRGAIAWAPDERFALTLSDHFQHRNKRDSDDFWIAVSDRGRHVLKTGTPEALSDRDRFNLLNLKAQLDLGDAELIANTSYYTRRERVRGYSGTLYNLSYLQQLLADGIDPQGNPCTGGQCLAGLYPLLTPTGLNLPGFGPYVSVATVTNIQENFVEEIRLQSSDAEARLKWIAGLFIARNDQHSIDAVNDPQLADLTLYLFDQDLMTAWGAPMLPNGDAYINDTRAHDRQLAGFANATFAVTDRVILQSGVRVARSHFDFENFADGPQNYGFSSGTGSIDETPVTLSESISYRFDDGMVYASYATGYRMGGANQPFPQAACQADLDALGITSVPTSFKSDTVASYEVGSKGLLLGGRLQAAVSLFHMRWNDIQQANYLSSCGFQYVANLGTARSMGFDLAAQWLVTDSFDLELAAGFVDARYTQDSLSGTAPGSPAIVRKGDALPGSPWSFSIGAEYRFTLQEHDFVLRLEDTFTGAQPRRTPQMDPLTTQYDPGLVNDPAINIAAVRLGTTLGNTRLSVFVENVFDAQPQLDLNHQDMFTLLYEASTLRPRTIGLSAAIEL